MEEMSGAKVTSTMNMVNERIKNVRADQTVKFNQVEAKSIAGSLLHLSNEIVELKQEIADITSSDTAKELQAYKGKLTEMEDENTGLKQKIEDLNAELAVGSSEEPDPK